MHYRHFFVRCNIILIESIFSYFNVNSSFSCTIVLHCDSIEHRIVAVNIKSLVFLGDEAISNVKNTMQMCKNGIA
jgi:hypothetical protein